MKDPIVMLRALVDKMNKLDAKRPPMPTGGDMRSTEEVLNTGANARGLASMATKAPVNIARFRK